MNGTDSEDRKRLCEHLRSSNQLTDQSDTVPVSDIKKAVREV